MITKEMLEKVNNGILTADAINGQTTEDEALIEEVIRIFSQVKTLLKEQPPASKFTKRFRVLLANQDKTVIVQDAYEVCDRLDASEASRKELLTALEEIAKGDGAYSKDPLKHAENCITNMATIAEATIEKHKQGTSGRREARK